MAGTISAVEPGSIAAKLQLAAGDVLLSVNGQEIADMIDYHFGVAEEELTLDLRKASGQLLHLAVTKDGWEDLGLSFASEVFDGIRACRNKCLFCFIDQLQPNPRATLLLKDDDYRMSFLEGNFITGTNLTAADLQRIKGLRLSPLYISVHATDPLLRGRLLGLNKPAPVLPLLERLIEYGVSVHTQIVLAPGLNDGAALEQTINELAKLAPGLLSIGIVPVGLTRFQRRPELRLSTAEEAARLLDWLPPRQRAFRKLYGTRLVFAADEFYIRAGRPFPKASYYEEFDQLENGIGMAALFEQEWLRLKRHLPERSWPKTAVVTGRAGAAALTKLWPDIERASKGAVELLPVENSFYGPTITVTGLLTGSCLSAALPRGLYQRYVIPHNMLKHGSQVFLDDMTVKELEQAVQTPVVVAQNNAAGLLKALLDLILEENIHE